MAAPYDTLETVLNATRVRILDAMVSLAGEILTDVQPATIQYVNNAWRRLQTYLVTLGYPRLIREQNILNIAPVSSLDPATQVSLSWSSYFNGAVTDTNVFLVGELIRPYKLWERQNGTNPPQSFVEMDLMLNGLPSVPKQDFQLSWEWREDAIWMPGARTTTDLRIRFAAFLPDFIAPALVAFSLQNVQIVRCQTAFSLFIAYEYCYARGDASAEVFLQQAQGAAADELALETNQHRSILKSSEYGKMADKFTPTPAAQQRNAPSL